MRPRVTVPPLEEHVLHTRAVIAARKAAGLELPTQSADDPWWDTGPHVEKDGRLFYVHAMGCLQAQLGQAVVEHPDWYFVAVLPQADAEYGVMFDVRGLKGELGTLEDVRAGADSLSPDERRLAIEFTNREKRAASRVPRI